MKKFVASLSALVIALALIAFARPAAADHPGGGGSKLSTTLTGAAEVPAGDPDGSGTAELRLNSGQEEICYELTAVDIAPATLAHIHVGAAGVAGPPLVHLIPPADGSSSGCVYASRELIKAIRKNPENYYVNVHNAEFKPGAIRGQLGK